MAKRYRLKIKTPWADKGVEIAYDNDGITSPVIASYNVQPADYPDLFEEITAPTPEDAVMNFLSKSLDANESDLIRAKKLIEAGLNPDKLK